MVRDNSFTGGAVAVRDRASERVSGRSENDGSGRTARRNTSAALVLAFLTMFAEAAWSGECDNVEEQYNNALRSDAFGSAAKLLADCANRCEKDRRMCADRSSILQSTVRMYIDRKLQRARSELTTNPGSALRRYRQVLEAGAVNPEVNAVAIQEANTRILELEPAVTKLVADLHGKGEQRLAANDYDGVRDTVYEIFNVDEGSEEGRALARKALAQYDRFIEEESARSEALLEELQQGIRSPDKQVRKHAVARAQLTMDRISSFVVAGLVLRPGSNHLVKLNDHARDMEHEWREKNRVDVKFKEADRQNRDTPEALLAHTRERLSRGDFIGVQNYSARILGALDPRHKADAFILRGLAHAVQININLQHSAEARQHKAKALAEFQSAARFESAVKVPSGYEQYAGMLEEAKRG